MMRYLSSFAVILVATATIATAQIDAKQQFQQKCSICHGADGKSQTTMAKNLGAPDLTSEKVQQLKDVEIRSVIERGKGKMAPYGTVLGTKGLDTMTAYVRALGGKDAPAGRVKK